MSEVKQESQQTLDSLLPQTPKELSVNRRKLQSRFYTVKPGTVYRTSPLGSEPGAPFGGKITEPTKIEVVGKRAVRSGIASVYAAFDEDGQRRTGWFTLKDIRRKT